ncbi:PREDICTED: titin isoform X4 [Nelumbo nucifera]|uniref:Titin isoform X4 n=1 Tax=Nelumbo nucifera TaxID=4432 RepID=A0A1U8Q0C8_NELNU|nr:PREDICTED: titin isoform X4 [Nelumbo nucifera]
MTTEAELSESSSAMKIEGETKELKSGHLETTVHESSLGKLQKVEGGLVTLSEIVGNSTTMEDSEAAPNDKNELMSPSIEGNFGLPEGESFLVSPSLPKVASKETCRASDIGETDEELIGKEGLENGIQLQKDQSVAEEDKHDIPELEKNLESVDPTGKTGCPEIERRRENVDNSSITHLLIKENAESSHEVPNLDSGKQVCQENVAPQEKHIEAQRKSMKETISEQEEIADRMLAVGLNLQTSGLEVQEPEKSGALHIEEKLEVKDTSDNMEVEMAKQGTSGIGLHKIETECKIIEKRIEVDGSTTKQSTIFVRNETVDYYGQEYEDNSLAKSHRDMNGADQNYKTDDAETIEHAVINGEVPEQPKKVGPDGTEQQVINEEGTFKDLLMEFTREETVTESSTEDKKEPSEEVEVAFVKQVNEGPGTTSGGKNTKEAIMEENNTVKDHSAALVKGGKMSGELGMDSLGKHYEEQIAEEDSTVEDTSKVSTEEAVRESSWEDEMEVKDYGLEPTEQNFEATGCIKETEMMTSKNEGNPNNKPNTSCVTEMETLKKEKNSNHVGSEEPLKEELQNAENPEEKLEGACNLAPSEKILVTDEMNSTSSESPRVNYVKIKETSNIGENVCEEICGAELNKGEGEQNRIKCEIPVGATDTVSGLEDLGTKTTSEEEITYGKAPIDDKVEENDHGPSTLASQEQELKSIKSKDTEDEISTIIEAQGENLETPLNASMEEAKMSEDIREMQSENVGKESPKEELQEDDENYIIELKDETTIERERTTECTKTTENIKPEILKNEEILEANSQDKLDDEEPFVELSTDHQKPGVCANIGKDVLNMEQEKATIKELDESIHEEGKEGDEVDNVSATLEQNPGNIDPIEKLEGASKSVTKDQRHVTVLETKETKIQEDNMTDKDLNTTAPIEDQAFTQSFQEDEKESMNLEDKRPKLETEDHNEKTKNAKETIKNILSNKDEEVSQGEHRTDACESIEKHIKEEEDATKEINSRSHGNEIVEASSNVMDFDLALTKLIIKESDAVTDDSIDAMTLNGKVLNKNLESSPLIEPSKEETGETESSEKQMNIPFLVSEVSEDIIREGFEQPKIVDASEESKKQVIDEEGIAITLSMESTKEEAVEEISQEAKETIGEAHEELATSEGETTKKMIVELSSAVEDHSIVTSKESSQEDEKHGILWTDSEGEVKEKQITENDSITENSSEVPIEEDTAKESFQEEEKEAKKPENVQEIELVSTEHNIEITSHTEEIEMMTTSINEEEILQKQKREYLESKEKLVLCGEKIKVDLEKEENTSKQLNTETIAAVTEGSRLQEAEQGYIQGASDSDSEDKNRITIETKSSSLQSLHVEHVNLEKKANLNVNAGKEILEASEKLETDECEQRIKYEMQVRASDTVPSFEIQVIEITIQTEKIAAKFPLDDKWEERLHESSTSSTKGKEFKSIETSKDIKDEDPIENETQDKNPENSLFSSTMEEMSTRKEELKMLEEVHQMQSEGIKTTSEKEINYGKAPLDEKIEENVQESSALASQEWEFKSIERSGDTKDENPTINEAQSKNVETPFNESTIETKVSEVILEIHSEDIGKESSNEELQEDTGEKDVQVKKMSPNEEFKKTKCTEPTKNIKPEAMKHEEILEAISEDKLYGQNPFVKLPEDLEKPGVCSNTEKDVQDLEQEKETIKKLDEIIEEDGKEGDQVENFMAILEQNPGDVDSGEMLKGASNPVTKDQSYIMIPDTKDTNTQENHMAAKDHNTASVEEQMVTQSFQEDEKRSRNSEDKGAKMDIEDHTEKTENTNEAIRNIPSNEDEEVTQEEDRADASKNTEKPIIDEENTAMELNTISLGDQTVEVSSNVRDCDLASNKLITKESHGTADDSMQTMDEEELNKNPESSVMEFPQEETIEKESSEKHMNVSSLVPEESEEKIIEECEEHKMVDVDPSEETRQQVMDEEGIVITLSMESMDEAAKEISQEVKKETIGEAHQEFATSEGEATKKMVVEESSAVKDHSTLPVKESHQKDEKYGVLQTVSAGEDTEEIIQNDGTVEDSSKVAPGEETAKESFQEDEIEVERHEKAKGFEKVSTKTNTGATSYREKIEMMEPSKNEEEILHKQKKEDLDSNEKIVVSEEHIKEDLEKEENKDKILDIATMTVVTEGAKLQEDEHKMLGVLDSSFKGKNLAAIETNSTSLQSLCVEHMNLENTINLSVHTDKGILETTEKVNTDEDEQKMKMGTFDTVPGFEEQIIETTTHTEITRSRDQLENKMEEKLHGYYTLLSTEKELKSNGTGKDEKDDAPVETKMQDKKKMQSSTLASQEVQMQSEISKTEVTSGKIPLDDKIEENVHESSTLASQEQELNPIERSDDIKDETPKINKAQDENLENPYSGNMTESKMSEDILEMKSEDVRKENLSEEKNHGDVDSGEKLEQASKTVAQNLSHVTIPETKLTKIQEDIIVDKDHDTAPVEDEMVTQSFQGDERESMNLEEKGFTLETDHTKKTDNTDETIQNILSNEDEEVTQGEGRAVASENIEKQNMEDNNSTKEVNITSCGDKKVEVTDTMTNCDLVSTELIIKEPDAAADDDTDTMTLKEFEQPKIVDASQENKKQVIDEEGALITLSIESTGEEAVKETSQEAKPESIEEAHEEHASSEEKVKEIKEGKTAPGGQVNEGFVTTSNGENTKEGVVEGNSNIKDHFAAPVKMICQGDKVEAPSDMHMSEELDTNSAGMQFEKQIAEEEGSMEAGKLNIRVKEELELAQQNIEETGCRVETEEASSQEVEPEEGNLGVVYSLASEENIPEIAEMNSTSMGSLEVKYVEVRDMSNLGKNVMEILGAGQLDEGAGGQNIKKCETVMEATNTQPGFQDKGIETTKETEIHFGKPQLEDKTDENVQEIPTLAPEQQELKPIERSEKRKDETPKINKAQDENLESPFNANMIGPNMSEDILEMQSENTRNKSSNEENTPGDVDSGEKIEQVPESISEDASHVKVPETKQTKIQEDNLIARDHNTAFIEDQIVPQSFQGEEKENMNLEDKGPILETEDMTKIPENANETNKKILSDEDEEVARGEDKVYARENNEKQNMEEEDTAKKLDSISLGDETLEVSNCDLLSTKVIIKDSEAAADYSTDTTTFKDEEKLSKDSKSSILTKPPKEEKREKESNEKNMNVSSWASEESEKKEYEQLKMVDASEEIEEQVIDKEGLTITLSRESNGEEVIEEISQEAQKGNIGKEAHEELASSEETAKESFSEHKMVLHGEVQEVTVTTNNGENTEERTVEGHSTFKGHSIASIKDICEGDKVQASSIIQMTGELNTDGAEKNSKKQNAKKDGTVEETSKEDGMETRNHNVKGELELAQQKIDATGSREETKEATSQPDEGACGQKITKSEKPVGTTNEVSELDDKRNEKTIETEINSSKLPLDDKTNENVQEASMIALQEQEFKPIEGNEETKDETPEINEAQYENLEVPDNANTRVTKMSDDILGMQLEDMGKQSTNEELNPRKFDSVKKLQQASEPTDEDQSCPTVLEMKETTVQEDIVDAKGHNNTASIEDQMATHRFQGDEKESMNLEEKEPTMETEEHTEEKGKANDTIKNILSNEDEEVIQGEDMADASENIEKHITDKESAANELDFISLGVGTVEARDGDFVSTMLLIKESDAAADESTDTVTLKDKEELNKNPESPLTEQSKEETRDKESSEKHKSVSPLMHEFEEKTKEESEQLKIVDASEEFKKQVEDEEDTIITLSEQSTREAEVKEISQESKVEIIGEAYEELANSEETIKERFPEDNMAPNRKVYEGLATTSNDENTEEGTVDGNSTSEDQFVATVKEICQGDKVQTSSFMQISRDLGKDSAEKDSKEKVAKEDDNVEDISTITIEEEAFKERSKQDRMEAVKHSLEVIKNMEAMQQIGATWCKEETEEATSQKVELEEDKLEVTCNLASEENIPETYEMNSSSLGSTQDKNVKVKESFNIEENVGEEIQGAEQLDEGENGQNITKSEKPVGATNTETELDDKNNVKTSETKINSCKFPLDEKTNENVQESPKMVSQEQKFKPIERNEETGDQTPEINKAQDENLETPDSANTREPKMSDDILGMKLEDMEKQSTNEEQNPRESDSGKKVQQASEPMGEDLSCSMVPKTKETTIQEDIVVAKDHDTVSIEDQMATHSFQGDEKEIMSLNEKGPTLETEDHIKKKQNVTETVKNIFSNENEEVIEREDRANASWNIEKHIMDEENTANKLDSISPGDEAVDINSNDVRDCDLVSTKLVVKESDAASEDSTEAMSLKDEEEVDKNPKETVYISSNVNIATQVRDSDLVSTKIVVKSDAAADDSTDTMSLKDEEKVNKNHESSPLTEQSKEETREKESSKKQMSLSSLVPKESEAKNKEEFEQLKIVDASEQTEKQVVDEEGTIISLPEESIGEAAVEEILQESKLEGIGEALEEPASSEETAKESFTEDKLAPDGKVNEGLPAINNVENTKERIVEGNSNIKDQSTAPDKEINQGDKVQASTIMQVSGDLDKDSAEKNFEKQITKEDGTVENTSIISTEEEALKEKSKQGRREEGKHSVEVKENELEPAQQNIEVTGCREETKEATPQEVEPEEEELNVAYKLASQENIPETAEMNPSSSESPEDKYVKAMNISYLDETMGEDIQGAEQLDEGEDGQNITKSETLMGATNTASKLNDKSNEKINETENTSGKSPLDDKINEIVQESSLMASQEQDLKPIEGNNETKDETPEINKAQDDNLETPDNATTRESKMSEDILGMQSEDMGKESTNEEQNPREVDSGNKLQQASKPMDEDQSCATFLETTIQEDIVDAKDHNNTASIEDQMATYSFQGDEEESMSLEEKEPTLEIESHTDKTKNATETIKGILLNEDEEVTQGEDRGDASENIEKYIMDTENTAKQLDSISLGDETFDVRDCNLVSTKLIVKESDAISDDRTDTMSFKDEEELNKNPKSYPLTEQSKEETREKESSEKPMSVSSLMPKESEEKTKEECEELKIVVASQETEKQMLDEEGTIITLSKESSAEDAVQEISQEAKTENIGEAHEEPANSEGKATKKMIVKESSAVKDHSTVTVKESSQEVDKHVVLSTDSSGEKTEKHIIDNEVTNDTSEVPTEEETDKKGFHEYEEEAKKPENVQEFELEATEQNFEATSDTEQTEIIATSMNEEELQKQNREDLERSKKLVMCEEQIEEDLGKEENKNKKIDMATITMVKEGSNLQEAEQGNMYGASDSDSEDKNRTTIETKSTSPENQHVGHVNLEKTTNLSLNIDKEILAAEENLDTDEGEQRIKCETQEGASDMVPLFENQVIEMTAQTENTASKVLSDDTLEEKFHESSVSEMKEKALKSMKTSQGINDEVPIENEAQDMNLETTLFCNTTEDMYTQKEEPKKLEEFIQKKTQDIEKDSSKEGLQEDGGIKLNRPTELDSEECISEFKNDAIQEMERTNECTEPSAYRQPEIQKDEESLVESLEKDKSDGGQPLDEAPEDLEKTDLTANIEKDIIHLEKEDDHVKNVEESFENIPGEGDLEHIIMSRTGNDGDEIKEASDSAKNESNLEEQNFGDDDPCEKIEGAYESLPGDQGNQIFPRNGEDCEVKVHNTVCFKDQVVNQNFQADEKVTMILEETGANLEAEDRTKKTEDAKETMMDGILNDSDKMPEGNDNADASESTEKQTSLGDGVLHEITKENDEKTEAINLKDEEVPINKPEASPITELLEEKITQKQSTEKFADGSLLVSGVYEGTIKEEILEGAEKSNEKLDDASVMTITEETSLEKSESEAERTVEASGVGSQEKISETVEKNETSLQHGEIKSVKLDENSNPVQPVLTIEAMDAEKEDVIVENLVADEVEETNRFSDRVSESNDQGVEVIAEPQSTTETSPQCEIRRVESNENPNPVPWLQSKEANSVKSDENSNPLPPLHHEEAKILENDQKSNLVTPLSTIEGKDDKKEYLLVENMGEDKVKEEISKSSDTVSQSKDQGFETITESEITVDQTPLADESEAKLQDPYAFVLEPEVAMATSIEKIKDKMFKEYETMEEKSSDFPFIMETSKETSFQKKEIRDPEVVLTVGIEGTENQSLIEKMCLQREEPRKLAQAYKKGLEDIMESPNTESEEKVVQKLDKSLKIDIEKQFFETKDAHSLLEREKITVVNEPSECSEHQTPKDEETLESNSQKEESERQKLENTFSEVFEGPETGGVRADTERGILEKDGCNENFEEHSEEERKNQNLDAIDPHEKINTAELEITNENLNLEKLEKISQSVPKIQIDQILANTEKNKNKEDGVHVIDQSTVLVEESQHLEKAEQDQCEEENEVNDIARGEEEVSEMIEDHTPSEKVAEWIPEEKGVLEDQHPSCVTKEVAKEDNQEGKEEVKKVEEDATALEHEDQIKELEGVEDHKEKINEVRLTCENSKEEASKELEDVNASENTRKVIAKEKRAVLDSYLVPLGEKICKEMHDEKEEEHVLKVAIKLDHKDQTYNVEIEDELRKKLDEANESAKCETLNEEVCYEINNAKANEKIEKKIKVEEQALKETSIAFSENETIRSQQEDEKEGKKIQDATKLASGDKNDEERGKKDMTGYSIANEEVKSSHFILVEQRLETTGSINQTGTVAMEDKQEVQVKVGNMPEELSGVVSKISVHERMKKKEDHSESRIEDTSSQKDLTEAENLKSTFSHRESSPSGITEYLHKKDMEVLTSDPSNPSLTKASQEKAPENRGKMARDEEVIRQSVFVKQAEVELSIPRDVKEENINDKAPIEEILKKEGKEKSEDGKIHETICTDQNGETKVQEREDQFVVLSTEQATVGRCIRDDTEELDAASNFVLKLKENSHVKTDLVSEAQIQTNEETESTNIEDAGSRNQNLDLSSDIQHLAKEIPTIDGTLNVPEVIEISQNIEILEEASGGISQERILRKEASVKGTGTKIPTEDRNITSVPQHTIEKTLQEAEVTYQRPGEISGTEPEEKAVEYGTKNGVVDEAGETIEEVKPSDTDKVSLSDLLRRPTKETLQMVAQDTKPPGNDDQLENKEEQTMQVEEEKTDEEEKDDEEEEDEHRKADSSSDAPLLVEASRDVDAKRTHKKSHNILSGVGSKVKHSIAKVKKAITGKSSQPKPALPK